MNAKSASNLLWSTELPVELRWITAVRATTWHTAERALSGARFVNAELLAALRPIVDRLMVSREAADGGPRVPVSSSLPLALGEAGTDETLGPDGKLEPRDRADLTKLFTEVEQVLRAAVPRIEQELALRAGPLQAQWDAFGPGLVHAMERRIGGANTDRLALRVALVYPICGGYARAFPAAQIALCEAVLTDIEARLPEVLRLAWLVGQQIVWGGSDRRSEPALPDERALSLAATAMTLSAAQELEMAKENRDTMELALNTWRPSQIDESATAAQVWDWWSAWRERPMAVPAALRELSRRLAPA